MKKRIEKHGFTLVELLVVIAIIGILVAALFPFFGRIRESAHATECRNNLIGFGRAANAYMSETEGFPSAGGRVWTVGTRENGNVIRIGKQLRGWVYWDHNCDRLGDSKKTCNCHDQNVRAGLWGGLQGVKPAPWFYDSTKDPLENNARIAIENGSLFSYMKSAERYRCKTFAKEAHSKFPALLESQEDVVRSYAMNYRTSASIANGSRFPNVYQLGDEYGNSVGSDLIGSKLSNTSAFPGPPNQTALIVELDVNNDNLRVKNGTAGDPVWDWNPNNKNGSGPEYIGFCHRSGSDWVGHVCFLDGHVDSVVDPGTDDKRKKYSIWLGSGGEHKDGVNYGN